MLLDVKKFGLDKLLEKIKCGEIQLPDFQRDWVWDDARIKSLLESVICGFPINSILLMGCDVDNLKFSYRTVEGVGQVSDKPQALILDGQQRLTSLFGALFSDKPVKVSNDKEFFYYVDMNKAIAAAETSEALDDLIISVPPNKKLRSGGKIKLDLSTPEKEFAAGMFPLNKIFKDTLEWIFAYTSYHANDDDKKSFVMKFNNLVVKKVSAYEIISVELEKNISLEAVCKIFEKVNIGVVKLDVFDLLTAVFAAHKTDDGKSIALRKELDEIKSDFEENSLKILSAIERTDFITALNLLVTYEKSRTDKKVYVSCKSEDILKLSYRDYLDNRAAIVDGFIDAAKFLAEEGITSKKYTPYKTQLVPMAAIFAKVKALGKDNLATRKKLRQWYWTSVFSEAYRDGHLNRFVKDIVQVMDWIIRDKLPEIVEKAHINAWNLMRAKSTQSAIYRGLISIIFHHGAKDFLAGTDMAASANFAESIEIHHVFPKKYCEIQKLPKERYDNVANRTPITKRTNKILGDNPPSFYLGKIEEKLNLSGVELDEILERHFIAPELCRADDFNAFLVDRAKKILDAVEERIGHPVSGRDSQEIKKVFGAPLQ